MKKSESTAPHILSVDQAQEYFFEEGCFILELVNSPDDPDVSIARARVPPGCTTRWHQLRGVRERYVLIQGRGMVEVGDHPPLPVAAGDVVDIPPNSPQRITNPGSEDLVFLAVCTPRFEKERYEDIDDARCVSYER